jgi:hypothetical protein
MYIQGCVLELTNQTIQNSYSLYIDNQGISGADKTVGLFINGSNSSPESYSILVNSGISRFNGDTVISSTSKISLTSNILQQSALNVSGDITLTNGTSQTILFNGVGNGIPSLSSRSLGTKIILKPSISAINTDYAIGVSNSELWFSTNNISSSHSFFLGNSKRFEISNNEIVLDSSGELVPIVINVVDDTKGIVISGGSGLLSGGLLELYGNGNSVLSSSGVGNVVISTDNEERISVSSTGITTFTSLNDQSLVINGGIYVDKNVVVGNSLVLDFNQRYTFSGNSLGNLIIQSQQSSISNEIKLFTKDGDNTDDNKIDIYGLGTPESVNTEFLSIGYDNNTTSYAIETKTSGTGATRPLVLQTPTNTNQVKLNTNNSIEFGGNVIINDTTESSGLSSGSFTTPGGASIAKKLYVGGDLIVSGGISVGVETVVLTITNTENISGSVVPINTKILKNGQEITLSSTFTLTPTVSGSKTSFQFSVPYITSNFTNVYGTITLVSGINANENSIENAVSFSIVSTTRCKIQFTSSGSGNHIIQIISRYTTTV